MTSAPTSVCSSAPWGSARQPNSTPTTSAASGSISSPSSTSPPGLHEETVNFDYAVPEEVYPEAVRAVRRAGFRVRPIEVDEWRGDIGVGFSAFRHFGVLSPSGEQQTQAREQLEAALQRAGVFEPVALGNGVVFSGGTPGHRWLEVTVAGVPIGLKVLVSSEEEIAAELDSLTTALFEGAPRDQLDVIRPDIWPIPIMFPRW